LVLAEPRLRDADEEEIETISVLDDSIDRLLPPEITGANRLRCTELLWDLHETAEDYQRASRGIEALRADVWEPFEKRARVLSVFGYLDFEKEKVTERGRWLADLHVDRPLVIGEALERGLFASLDKTRMAAVMAALASDEDRDYGELELDDPVVETLSQFEEIGFKVSTEEWKHGVEPAPELNFSAAATAARWVSGGEWSTLVQETRAEEGDLFRMLSRTGEALLQVAGLVKVHSQAAHTAAATADIILREPVR